MQTRHHAECVYDISLLKQKRVCTTPYQQAYSICVSVTFYSTQVPDESADRGGTTQPFCRWGQGQTGPVLIDPQQICFDHRDKDMVVERNHIPSFLDLKAAATFQIQLLS